MSRWSEPTSGCYFSTRVFRSLVGDVECVDGGGFVARVTWRNGGGHLTEHLLGCWPSMAEARAACDEYMLAVGGDSNGGCEGRVRALEKEVAGLRQRVSDLETYAATFPSRSEVGSASVREFRQSLGRDV